jgi:integrase
MPPARLPHLHHERTRHGRMIWVVRVGHGPRTRLRATYGSAEFFAEYRAAVENPRAHRPLKGDGTFEWLWTLYQRSPAWTSLRPATQRDRTRLMRVALERAGNQPLEVFTRKFIVASRDARSATPGVARNFLNALRSLFAWALDSGHVEMDPTVGIKPPKQLADGGFHTWSADEMARFESRWPLGTRERLAYDIMLWTGLRRGDAARLGPQHVIDGQIVIQTEKTRHEVAMPILEPLARSIAAAPGGDESFVATADGKPMVKDGFGSWFAAACKQAGVPGRAHGLRKALAVKLAEAGATPLEIGAILGNDMGAFYARKANRGKLAAAALSRLSAPSPSGNGDVTG